MIDKQFHKPMCNVLSCREADVRIKFVRSESKNVCVIVWLLYSTMRRSYTRRVCTVIFSFISALPIVVPLRRMISYSVKSRFSPASGDPGTDPSITESSEV